MPVWFILLLLEDCCCRRLCRYVHYVNRVRKDDDASSEPASEANYVYTRALAHTPVQ